ncbi:MAG TPA: acetyl-CoA C-acyltransferase [Nocardioides sp.]|jgi:acetyl-CoA C-acetyltransferase|uniref:acetyl-CoA C-acyltransferase n=1 Tax=Nocardioides sp. TaxID=35761 RepID=UPI002E322BED|nr:acetyl-CoA C-acyltransferase [Nocardioides sp.]HEX3931156.1 acetyl-CoA C-acyltransferase [Nocardioides sp.]
MTDTVIIDALRSPIGRAFKGSLVDVRPDDLAATVVKALLDRNPALPPEQVDDVICGVSVAVGEQAYNLGRIVGQLAGLPSTVPGTTVNRFCASSLQALRMAHHAIQADEGDVFVVVGVESVTRRGRAFEPEDLNPRMIDQGRPDFVNQMYMPMLETAERVATIHGITRDEMDEIAVRSHTRALAAGDDGTFARETLPIETRTGTMDHDDGPRPGTSMETLAALKPILDDGLVTAGNACPINDGAAAAIVMSSDRAAELGLTPRARVLGSNVTGLEPELMGLGPIEATRGLLSRTGTSVRDLDVVELNEAFAAQVIPVCRELGVDIEAQLNPFGGAIALGHPFGMTGVRMVTTLLNALQSRDGELGLVTQCIGGGQGMSMLFERVA